MLCRALLDLGVTNVVLESGSYCVDDLTRDDLATQQAGPSMDGLRLGRTRQVGGGLNLWGGQLALLESTDLVRSKSQRLMRWPISHEELYQYVDRVLAYAGASGIDFRATHPAVAREAAKAREFGLTIVQTGWLKRPKFDKSFWQTLNASKAAKIL